METMGLPMVKLQRLILTAACSFFAWSCAAVEINQATAAELDGIRGIGPGLSTPILAERNNGAFKNWPDLIGRVKGIGPRTAAKFSAQGLTVDGMPYEPALPPIRRDKR